MPHVNTSLRHKFQNWKVTLQLNTYYWRILAQISKLENNASDEYLSPGSFTANLVLLLHIFVFLTDLFLFSLHFQCVF